MRKFLLLTICAVFCTFYSFSQIRGGQIPVSLKNNIDIENVDIVVLNLPDVQLIKDGLDEAGKNGTLYTIGTTIEAGLNTENSGTWFDLEDGSKIWKLKIQSKGAKALSFFGTDFSIPYGSELYIFSEGNEYELKYSSSEIPLHGDFETSLIQGDIINIEYYQPQTIKTTPNINIEEIGYFYRDVDFVIRNKGDEFGSSDYCEVNINCSEGNNWQDKKRGVARILVKDSGDYGWCSGSLVNNTEGDCTHYFLTAFHCGGTSSEADFNVWKFYFNYEADGCENPAAESEIDYYEIAGAKLLSSADISGGSDFIFLKLNYLINPEVNPYFNGWDNKQNTASTEGVGIHHPSGDIKKISTYTSTVLSSSPVISGSHMAFNSAWNVGWSSTANGHGVTEGGSSGSPLFDNNGRIVGTLSGGASFCSQPLAKDSYGKFSYHWASNGGNSSVRLKDWLDPNNDGVNTVDGKYCTATPVIDFEADVTTISVGDQVKFTNQSQSYMGSSYRWYFDGGSPSTSAIAAGKTVTYNTPGTYRVGLKLITTDFIDTLYKENYITVLDGDAIDEYNASVINIYPNPTSENVYVNLGTISSSNISLMLIDIAGRVVGQAVIEKVGNNIYKIELANINEGNYFVKISINNNVITKPITVLK